MKKQQPQCAALRLTPSSKVPDHPENENDEKGIPLEVCHEVSDIADSLNACMEVLYEANQENWMVPAYMFRPLVERLHKLTGEHFPG